MQLAEISFSKYINLPGHKYHKTFW